MCKTARSEKRSDVCVTCDGLCGSICRVVCGMSVERSAGGAFDAVHAQSNRSGVWQDKVSRKWAVKGNNKKW